MTELFIDNQLADIDSHTEISVSLAAPLVGSSPLGRAGYSKTITIPATLVMALKPTPHGTS